jgi:hypothetical protein
MFSVLGSIIFLLKNPASRCFPEKFNVVQILINLTERNMILYDIIDWNWKQNKN